MCSACAYNCASGHNSSPNRSGAEWNQTQRRRRRRRKLRNSWKQMQIRHSSNFMAMALHICSDVELWLLWVAASTAYTIDSEKNLIIRLLRISNTWMWCTISLVKVIGRFTSIDMSSNFWSGNLVEPLRFVLIVRLLQQSRLKKTRILGLDCHRREPKWHQYLPLTRISIGPLLLVQSVFSEIFIPIPQ